MFGRADDDKASTARRRSALRLLCELHLAGVHHNTMAIIGIVRALAAADHQRDASSYQAALSLLAGFAKAHRVEFLGFRAQLPADLPATDEALPEVIQAIVLFRTIIHALEFQLSLAQPAAGQYCLHYLEMYAAPLKAKMHGSGEQCIMMRPKGTWLMENCQEA